MATCKATKAPLPVNSEPGDSSNSRTMTVNVRLLTSALELSYFCWSMGVRLEAHQAGCASNPTPAHPACGGLLERTVNACAWGRCYNPATFLAVRDYAMAWYQVAALGSIACMLLIPRVWQAGLWWRSAVAIRLGTIGLHLLQLLILGPHAVDHLSTYVHSMGKSRMGLAFLGYWGALSLSVPLRVHVWAGAIEAFLAICVSGVADIGTHGSMQLTAWQVVAAVAAIYLIPMVFILRHSQEGGPNHAATNARGSSISHGRPGAGMPGPKAGLQEWDGVCSSSAAQATPYRTKCMIEAESSYAETTAMDGCSQSVGALLRARRSRAVGADAGGSAGGSGSRSGSSSQDELPAVPMAHKTAHVTGITGRASDASSETAMSSMSAAIGSSSTCTAGGSDASTSPHAQPSAAGGLPSMSEPVAPSAVLWAPPQHSDNPAVPMPEAGSCSRAATSPLPNLPSPTPSAADSSRLYTRGLTHGASERSATSSVSPFSAAPSHAAATAAMGAGAAAGPYTQARTVMSRKPGASLMYKGKTQTRAVSIKVYNHPGTYEQYAAALSSSALSQLSNALNTAHNAPWLVQAACVRGCVQLFVWITSAAAATAAHLHPTRPSAPTAACASLSVEAPANAHAEPAAVATPSTAQGAASMVLASDLMQRHMDGTAGPETPTARPRLIREPTRSISMPAASCSPADAAVADPWQLGSSAVQQEPSFTGGVISGIISRSDSAFSVAAGPSTTPTTTTPPADRSGGVALADGSGDSSMSSSTPAAARLMRLMRVGANPGEEGADESQLSWNVQGPASWDTTPTAARPLLESGVALYSWQPDNLFYLPPSTLGVPGVPSVLDASSTSGTSISCEAVTTVHGRNCTTGRAAVCSTDVAANASCSDSNVLAHSLQQLVAQGLPDAHLLGPVDVQSFGGFMPGKGGVSGTAGSCPVVRVHPSEMSCAGSGTVVLPDGVNPSPASEGGALRLLWAEPPVLDLQQLQAASSGNGAQQACGEVLLHAEALEAMAVRVLLLDASGQLLCEQQRELAPGLGTIRLDCSSLSLPACSGSTTLQVLLTPPVSLHHSQDPADIPSSPGTLVYASTRLLVLPSDAAEEVCQLWEDMQEQVRLQVMAPVDPALPAELEGLGVVSPKVDIPASPTITTPGICTGWDLGLDLGKPETKAHEEYGLVEVPDGGVATAGLDVHQHAQLAETAWVQYFEPLVSDLAFLLECTAGSPVMAVGGTGGSVACIQHGSDTRQLAEEVLQGLLNYFEQLGMNSMRGLLVARQACDKHQQACYSQQACQGQQQAGITTAAESYQPWQQVEVGLPANGSTHGLCLLLQSDVAPGACGKVLASNGTTGSMPSDFPARPMPAQGGTGVDGSSKVTSRLGSQNSQH